MNFTRKLTVAALSLSILFYTAPALTAPKADKKSEESSSWMPGKKTLAALTAGLVGSVVAYKYTRAGDWADAGIAYAKDGIFALIGSVQNYWSQFFNKSDNPKLSVSAWANNIEQRLESLESPQIPTEVAPVVVEKAAEVTEAVATELTDTISTVVETVADSVENGE